MSVPPSKEQMERIHQSSLCAYCGRPWDWHVLGAQKGSRFYDTDDHYFKADWLNPRQPEGETK